ncbi:DUF1648 domain-containing protein [Gulosibacter sp. GYB002]|uniref:DUF1648 domain-containing protein n=1 Tax=Gulosibacter sp. GYB002 TaxID=2994391 RepID=UPI002F963957
MISAIAISVTLLAVYPSMSEIVPIHFDVNGEPDSFGPKTSVFVLIAIMLAITVLIFWFAARPRIVNYPVPVTADNAARLYALSYQLLVLVGVGMQLIYAGITAALLASPITWLLWVGLAVLLVSPVIAIVLMVRQG